MAGLPLGGLYVASFNLFCPFSFNFFRNLKRKGKNHDFFFTFVFLKKQTGYSLIWSFIKAEGILINILKDDEKFHFDCPCCMVVMQLQDFLFLEKVGGMEWTVCFRAVSGPQSDQTLLGRKEWTVWSGRKWTTGCSTDY